MSNPNDAVDLGFNPYESPKAIGPGAPTGALPFNRNAIYRSAHLRGMWAVAMLVVMCLINGLGIINGIMQYKLLDGARHGAQITPEMADENDTRYMVTTVAEIAMYLVTSIPFLMWMHRVYKNLPALGAKHLDTTPGMAVGWWFVPFANLVKPYTTVVEIWRNSDPLALGQYAARPSTALVGVWWAAYLIRNIGGYAVGQYANSATGQNSTLDDLIGVTVMLMICDVISIIAAVLAMMVVRKINALQDARYDALQDAVPVAEVV